MLRAVATPLLRFRYGSFRMLLTLGGMGPTFTGMQVSDDRFIVRFSYGFWAKIPRSSIVAVDYDYDFVGGIGVHGFRGHWLVNGAASGIVRIDLEPPSRAFVMGFPVRLRQLRVSAEDPARLISALKPR
jgi:hypothetical protein